LDLRHRSRRVLDLFRHADDLPLSEFGRSKPLDGSKTCKVHVLSLATPSGESTPTRFSMRDGRRVRLAGVASKAEVTGSPALF
jgi:hypothetical protein